MIYSLTVGFMQENTYIIERDHNAIIIDPGAEALKIKQFLSRHELSLDRIFLTHAHFDHIGAVDELVNTYHCPVFASTQAIVMAHDSYTNLSSQFTPFTLSSTLTPLQKTMKALDLTIEVIATPGHTDGDVCFYVLEEKALFTGDTLFKGSAGRTDFPTGSFTNLLTSLAKLKNLNGDLIIYPGHMETTTLKQELKDNAYLQ